MSNDTGRKLASVRRIAAIDPIEGADRIVCVTVDGWKLVSDKSNGFQVGDLVIYFEIDSFLPIRPEFEWMRDRCYKNITGLGEGFRVKTIKLRGQVSQGLIVPLSDFIEPGECLEIEHCAGHERDSSGDWVEKILIEEGTDLTDFIGVKKYEKPIPANMQGRTKGNFPSFIPKTDEERIQNNWGGIKKWIFFQKPIVEEITDPYLLSILEEGKHPGFDFFKNGDMWFKKEENSNPPEIIAERAMFEGTLKLDGSSCTVYLKDGQFGVCSRNLELVRDPENPFWKAVLQAGILGYMVQRGENVALQLELMGPGVQGNREKLEELHLFLFNIYDIDTQEYLLPRWRHTWFKDMMSEISPWEMKYISHAPIIFPHLELTGKEDVQYFLDQADKAKSFAHDIAEGIVYKSHVRQGPSFKAISNKFLLKESD